MLLGARNFFMGGGKPTAKSYIQDGLILQYDGIENAGFGLHDSTALTWKDLVGNNDATLLGSATFEDDCIYFPAYVSTAQFTPLADNNNMTIEFVTQKFFTNGSAQGVISLSNSYQNSILCTRSADPIQGYQFAAPTGAWKVGLTWGDTSKHSISMCYNGGAYKNGELSTVKSTDYWYTKYPGKINGDNTTHSDRNGDKSKFFSIRVYSRALTAAEVAANYAVDKARFNLP